LNTFYYDLSKSLDNYFIYFGDKFVNEDEDKIGESPFFSPKYDTKSVFKNIYFKLCDILKFDIDVKISVLPDFFIDRIIQISNMNNLIEIIENKIRVGGGSIRGLNSVDIKGGN
jgi:ribokinase